LNPTGQTVEFTATGFLARVLQHEIDHLNGILFVDRLPATARNPIAAISLETGSR
jgi:peptide deformylase